MFQKILNLIAALRSGDGNKILEAILAFFDSTVASDLKKELFTPDRAAALGSGKHSQLFKECADEMETGFSLTKGTPKGSQASLSGLFTKFWPIFLKLINSIFGIGAT